MEIVEDAREADAVRENPPDLVPQDTHDLVPAPCGVDLESDLVQRADSAGETVRGNDRRAALRRRKLLRRGVADGAVVVILQFVEDIGSFFPPGDPRWKDADSAIFLNLAMEELQHAGFRIVNIDTTLILTAPKIGPVAGEMRARVADLLEIDIDQVSIKAKTPEGLNLDHVAQCHAVALVERVVAAEGLKSMSAVIESQRQLEDVVEDLLSSVHGVPKKRVAPVYDTEDIT